jgi:cobalt/nickel transport system ATP-binding protein
MLRFEHVSYSYQKSSIKALDDVSFVIQQGAKVALMGANGAGKSTAMCMMNGLVRPDFGKIYFQESPIEYRRKSLKKLRQNIGIVFQNPESQIFSGVVQEDVAYGPINLGLSEKEVNIRVKAALSAVGLSTMKEELSYELSFGQKQRLALAGALAMEPQVLVLDEPTSGLDPQYADKLMEHLEELHQSGMTVIISSHDVERMWTWADYFIIMKEGKLICEGTPEEVFQKSEVIKKSGIAIPILYQVYLGLRKKGLINQTKKIPKTVDEMHQLIDT